MTPQEEIQVRQMMALQNAARSRGLLGNTSDPYARGLRPPTDAERARLDVTNPEMPLNDLARARLEAEFGADAFKPRRDVYGDVLPPPPGSIPSYTLAEAARRAAMDGSRPMPPPGFDARARLEAERPFNPDDVYAGGSRFFDESAPYNPNYGIRPPETMAEYYRRMGINPGRPTDGSPPSFSPNTRYNPDGTPIPPVGGEVAADPEPEEYDGFVNSGTGQRGYLDFKYMPTPMAQAAPPVANTAYNAPPVANTAYMPPPTDAPVNTAYMPSRRTVPVDTTYRPPASANTTYMPSPSPSYGMSTTPTYNMSTSTTPTYGTSNGGQIREPSYSPNQAGKYKVDGPRLRNTGGLFNDLNAFFGRPQT